MQHTNSHLPTFIHDSRATLLSAALHTLEHPNTHAVHTPCEPHFRVYFFTYLQSPHTRSPARSRSAQREETHTQYIP
ncbi:hypothetical protein BC567DRAFT_238606 [Phyllosticta citribraziliensis]